MNSSQNQHPDTQSIVFNILEKDTTIPANEIVAMVEHHEHVWIGINRSNGGQILKFARDKGENSYHQVWPNPNAEDPVLPALQNMNIAGLYSTERIKQLIVHLTGNESGKIMLVDETREHPCVLLPKEAKYVAVNPVGDYPMVTANGAEFTIYKNDRDTETHSAEDEITALAINSSGVAFYAGNKYQIFGFQICNFSDVITILAPKPYIIPFDDQSFIFCLPGTMTIKNESQPPGEKFYYNKGFQNLLEQSERPNIMLLYQERLYEFYSSFIAYGRINYKYQESFQTKPIGRIKIVAKCDNALYLVSDTDVRQYGGQTKGTQCGIKAIKAGLDVAITMFNSLPPETQPNEVIDFFKHLWQLKNYELALKVLTVIVWPHDIREIISLFSPGMVDLAQRLESRILLSGLHNLTDEELKRQDIKRAFGDFLLMTKAAYSQSTDIALSSQLVIINSTLFQFYAINHLTRELDSFLKEKPAIDYDFIAEFLNEKVRKLRLQPALAIYQQNCGIAENNLGKTTALAIWRKLDEVGKGSKRWAMEASFTLIPQDPKRASESFYNAQKFEALMWIVRRDPIAAVNAFAYPEAYIREREHFERFKNSISDPAIKFGVHLRFLDYVTSPAARRPNNDLLKLTLERFCTLQMLLESHGPMKRLIEPGMLIFCDVPHDAEITSDVIERAKKATEETIIKKASLFRFSDVEPESDNIIERTDIVRYTDILLGKDIVNIRGKSVDAKKTTNRRLLLKMFQIGAMYKEGANELIDSRTARFLKPEVQDFCRDAPHPEVAFSVIFEKIMNPAKFTAAENLGIDVAPRTEDFGPEFKELLEDNLEWIDCDKMIDLIPDNASLEKYSRLLLLTESVLIEKERLVRAKLDITCNMELDAGYRLVCAQKRNVEIQHDTCCKICQRPVGNGWLSISPKDEVFHIACVKNDEAKKQVTPYA